jgi:hypothetical protein
MIKDLKPGRKYKPHSNAVVISIKDTSIKSLLGLVGSGRLFELL